MNSWKSFVKNVADKAQDFSSPVRVPGSSASGETAPGDAQTEGFICPICMKGFTDPVELQQCFNKCSFENENSNNPPPSMSNSSNGTGGINLKDNLKALQNTLEEERRYSAQLQREVNQFSEDVHRTKNHSESHCGTSRERSQLLEEEKALLETQVTALEEGKKLLSLEVEQLKRNLDDTQQKLTENEKQLKTSTEKSSNVEAENANLKRSLDEMKTQNQVAEEKIKILNTVVEQRNNIDDVAILRKELQNVQTTMMTDIHEIKSDTKLDEMRQENESLKSELSTLSLKHEADSKTHSLELKFSKEENIRLQGENQKLTEKVETLSSNLTAADAESSSERRKVDLIQTDLDQRTKELLAAKNEYEQLKEKNRVKLEEEILKAQKLESALNMAEERLNGQQGQANDLTKEVSILESRCNEQTKLNGELKEQLSEKTNALEDALRHNINKSTELEQVKGQVTSLQTQISQLNTEREELLGKIEAGDGAANTAMQQLKLQNDALSKQVQSQNDAKKEIVEENKRQLEQLHTILNETKTSLTSSNVKSKKLEVEKDALTNKLTGLASEKTKAENDLIEKKQLIETNKANSEKRMREMQAIHEKLEAAQKASVAQYAELEIQKSKLESDLEDKDNQNIELTKEQKSKSLELQKMTQNIKSLSDQLSSKSEQLNSLTASNAELNTNVATLNTQKTRLDGQLKESSTTIRKLNDEKKQMIAQMEEVTRNCTSMQQQLQDANNKVEMSEQSIKTFQEEMAQKLKENMNTIEAAKEQNKDLQIQLESKSSLLKDLSEKNAEIEVEIDTIRRKLEEKTSEKEDVEKRICLIQTEHEKDKSKYEEKMKDFQDANESLQKSKLELQNNLEDANSRTNILKQEIEKVKVASRKGEEKLDTEISHLKAELAKQSSIQTNLENRLSEKESELDQAITSNKEAVAEAYEREKVSQDKLSDINKQLDYALSAKLELEAKVESTSDEMRSLLERCLGAESELDRSRSSLIELRRKLDDSQAALHELGRENQSIQVDLAKQQGRKWADDNEVNSCYACQSAFSITNRKHHCRNCGQIFCADCSNKQATMPNYKKPQRVCEPCFGELQQGK